MIDKTQNPAEIYLIIDSEGDLVWCDTPAPGEGMREEDATRYVREDIYLALQAQVFVLREDLAKCRIQASYSIGGIEGLEEQLSRVRMISSMALAATPAQCLTEVKAQAVSEFGEDIIAHFEGCNYNLTLQTLKCYLYDQLRQQAKAGSNG